MTSSPPAICDRVRLRLATPDDWPMIRRWLGRPEVIRWWGPRATTEAEIMLAMSTPQAICRIIEAPDAASLSASASAGGDTDGGRWLAVGYAHALDAGLAGPPRVDGLPPGTWQIDVFVASPEHRGRGIGGFALLQMRDEVFETTLAVAAAARVAVGNEKAVRAYEQAGFKWRAIARDRDRGAEWLMLADRGGRLPERLRSHGVGDGNAGGSQRLL